VTISVVQPGQEDSIGAQTTPERAAYLRDFLRLGLPSLIEARDLERFVVFVDGKPVPVVVNDGSEDSCYLISPHAHYVKYMLLELRKIRGASARVLEHAVGLLGRIGLPLGFNRCVSANNWLLTTNPRPDLTTSQLKALTEELIGRYPTLPVVIRTVDTTDSHLERACAEAGYRLIVNRPVHGWESAWLDRSQRRKVRRELGLLSDPDYSVHPNSALTPGEADRICQLYRSLYLKKHAGYNCHYTPRFFRSVMDSGLMRFGVVRRQGEIQAFVSLFEDRERLVGALIGYDTSLDQRKFPLYRMSIAMALQIAMERDRPLFLSTGSARFKRSRGSREWLEHEAVFDRHLPRRNRVPWAALELALDASVDGLDTRQI